MADPPKFASGFWMPNPARPADQQAATCAPLCAAAKAYGRFAKWWQHEPQCPVRQEHDAHDKAELNTKYGHVP